MTPQERARARRLKTLFDLTPAEYEAILEYQRGGCAICARPPGKTRLAVDHNHKTGLVRGLLCWTCNTALGKFRDNDEHVGNAAEYVNDPPATRALERETFGVLGRTTTKRKTRKRREKTASTRKRKTTPKEARSNGSK